MRAFRLIARGRVGIMTFLFVQAEAVKTPCAGRSGPGKIARLLACQRVKRPGGVAGRAFLEHDIDSLRFRRPHPKMGFFRPNDLRADGITAREQCGRGAFSRRDNGLAGGVGNFSFHPKNNK